MGNPVYKETLTTQSGVSNDGSLCVKQESG